LLVYCAIVRPVYGPYDWDLFSLTAVWTSLTAASALSRKLPARAFLDLATLVTGLAAFTTAIPMLVIGLSARPESGPFSPELAPHEAGRSFEESFERRVAPWI
jgi:hypothetical protein